ncbi:unnamed protein product [Choristocarpus tenellus]
MERIELLGEQLDSMARSVQGSMVKLNAMRAKDYPFPSLILICDEERETAAVGNPFKKRAQRVVNRAKGLVSKARRLHFLCPYDGNVVPCGLDGRGYPFRGAREWVTKLYPVMQVTAVIVAATLKAASGVEIPASNLLNNFKEELGVEILDTALDNKALQQMLDGEGSVEAGVQTCIRKSYEDLKEFMTKQEVKKEKRRQQGEADVRFEDVMTLLEDGGGGMVWVSNHNINGWNAQFSSGC